MSKSKLYPETKQGVCNQASEIPSTKACIYPVKRALHGRLAMHEYVRTVTPWQTAALPS